MEFDQPNLPGLVRLNKAAKLAGLDPEVFAQAVKLQQIPLQMVEIGPRKFRHLHSRRFLEWLHQHTFKDAA
jgi:hypothetical protein